MINTEPAMFQHVVAAPDAAGNPRRLYAIYGTDGSLLVRIEEARFGRPGWFDDLIELPAVAVSAEEYQRWLLGALQFVRPPRKTWAGLTRAVPHWHRPLPRIPTQSRPDRAGPVADDRADLDQIGR